MNKKIYNETFCNGTWKHKYNTAVNEKMANDFGESNDRTAYDVGVEQEKLTNYNQ